MLHGEIPEGMYVDHEDGNKQNNKHDNLVLKTPRGNQQNKGSSGRNTSGATGVSFWTNWITGCEYARAYASDTTGKMHTKLFSVKKLGREGAWNSACKERAAMLERFNAAGAQYTERHGKEVNVTI
jgi:hypothetical protein